MATRPRRPIDPYTDALSALARRELTSAQLETRLQRRGCDPATIQEVLARLRAQGALDDRRAALAIARTSVHLKRRGPRRVQQELQQRGVDRDMAAEVVGDVLGAAAETELIEQALAKRLRGPITDRRHFERLYRYLVRQGFGSDQALAALRRRRGDLGDD